MPSLFLFCYALIASIVNPVALVNPFIGTTMTYDKQDVIDDFPGADVPFGMVQWSPDTPSQDAGGGYDYTDTAITGFSLDHLAGPGCSVFGDFGILPTTGTVRDPAAAKQPFLHASEVAAPGYYAVSLGNPSIRTQLTVTKRTGLGEFDFPAGAQANLLFNASSNQAGILDASVHVTAPDRIAGSAVSGRFCGLPDIYRVYFAAQFDRPFTSYGTWKHKQLSPGSAQSSGAGSGAWVTFDTSSTGVVKVKVGLSFVSEAGALANLRAENPGWDLTPVRNAAASAWQKMLSRVSISGGTHDEQVVFYSALYRTLLHPNVISDVDGSYPGFDGKIHRARAGHAQYGNFSGWDIYRTQAPLMGFLAPQEASDAAQSLLDEQKQGGWFPKWPLVNGYTAVMAGDAADTILASYYAFGARDFDAHGALAAMVKGAALPAAGDPPGQGWYVERLANDEYLSRGYVVNDHTTNVAPVPNGASETLEYALADFSIAQFARSLGDAAVYKRALARSQNWANLFDVATGLIAPRDADGAFMQTPITDAGQSGFQEGNAAQYTWMTQQDYADLIRGMGGRAATIEKLNTYFSQLNAQQNHPYAWMGNEPSIGDPFAYLAAGEPWRAQQVIRTVQTTQWLNEPQGLAGNDDLGTMSAWYVWNAMGLYPELPALRRLTIGTPLFRRVEVNVPNGPRIVVDAPQASDTSLYVQALRVNGKAQSRTWIDVPMRGPLRLDFAMASAPNQAWGAAPQDAPPSYTVSPVHFPPATLAALQSATTDVDVAPGRSAAIAFRITNASNGSADTVAWKAQAPAGLSLQPSFGNVSVAPGASITVNAALSASADLGPGYYDVPVTAAAANGAVIPRLTITARVQAPRAAYVLNSNESSITPIDPVHGSFGPALKLQKNSHALALSPDGSRLYVLGDDTLQLIDTASMRVVRTLVVGKDTPAIAVSTDGNSVYVAQHGKNAVLAIDAQTLELRKTIPFAGAQSVLAPDASTLYVFSDGGSAAAIDERTGTVGATFAVPQNAAGEAVSPDGKTLYVVRGVPDDDVVTLDLATRAQSGVPIAVGVAPASITLARDGSTAYVTNWAARTVTPIDLRSGTAHPAIGVCGGPLASALTPDAATLLVVCNEDDMVVPIDVRSGRLGTPIRVGRAPGGIAL
jgi:predicted alpha-1,2-mannosidase